MTPENELIDKIRHYFNIVITDENRAKLMGFIADYKESLPVPDPQKVVERIVESKIKVINSPFKSWKTHLPVVAEFVCKKHNITLEQLKVSSPAECYKVDDMKGIRRSGRSRKLFLEPRREFASIMRYKYGATYECIGKFLGYKTPANSQLLVNHDVGMRITRDEINRLSKTIRAKLTGLAAEVCMKHHITLEELRKNSPLHFYKGEKRQATEYIKARKEFSKIAHYHYKASIAEISRFIGYKSHASVLHLLGLLKTQRQDETEEAA